MNEKLFKFQKENQLLTKTAYYRRIMPTWFKFSLFLTFFALVCVSAGLLFTETLIDTPNKQLEALRNQDIETAYKRFSSKEFKSKMSFLKFQAFVHSHPALLHNQIALFPKRSIVDNETILKGKLLMSDNTKVPIEYRLIKEEGNWKILSLKFLERSKKINNTKIKKNELSTSGNQLP